MRKDWDIYFMDVAATASTRATCNRKHVGVALVIQKIVVATGYNGSISGMPHCDDEGHLMENDHCVRTVHAEMNAIAQAAQRGTRVKGATAYITAFPCWTCFRLLIQAGITRIVYDEPYRMDEKVREIAEALKIEILQLQRSA